MPDQPVTPLQDNAPQTTPSTVSDNQIPNPIPANTTASLGVTPSAPSAPSPSVTTPRPAPSPAAQAQNLHTSIFRNILGTLAGGSNRPVLGSNGQPQTDANGQVVMAPASKKALGASILAGALSAMVAGYAAPTSRTETGGGRSVQDFGPSAAAGAAASQPFTQAGSQAAAQEKANAVTAAQYAATDHNLKMHAAVLGNLKLQGEVMNEGVTQDAPLIEAMKLNPTTTDAQGHVLSVIKGEHVSEQALQKMMADGSAHVTRDSVLRDGVSNVYGPDGKQIMNPDGTPRQEYTYTVYDHNAEVAMTDEMKKGNPALQYVAAGTPVPMAVLAKYGREKMDVQNAQGFVNQWAQQNADFKGDKTPSTIDLKAAIAKDPYLRKLIPQLGRYAGMEPDQAIGQMKTDNIDPALIGKFSQLFGGINENDWKLKRADDILKQKNQESEDKVRAEADAKRKTPEGQADLLHKQLENQALIQAAEQTKAAQQGVVVPPKFVADPHAASMDAAALSKDLASKGVTVPSDFQTLYSVAHNDVSDDVYTNNPRPKSGLMARPQAVAFIRTFINPQFQEGDFRANANLQKELRDTRVGTAGGSLLSAGTAAQHLDMLEQVAKALENNDVQAINKVKAAYNVQTGAPNTVLFKAIAQKVNTEVEKAVSGGAPHEAELKTAADNLNVAESPQQIRSVIGGYLGLMNGRIGEIDDRSYQYTGRHIPVSPTTTAVFNRYGYTVPGQPAGSHPVIINGRVLGFTVDGKTMTPVPVLR